MLHSFWGLMVADNRCLLVSVGSVIFWLAHTRINITVYDDVIYNEIRLSVLGMVNKKTNNLTMEAGDHM